MRFGLFIPQGWRHDLVGIDPSEQWETMRSLARYADTTAAGEGLPGDAPAFESVWVYDHFHTVPEPSTEATHEAWSLMAAFAASTERVRLGQMCTCMAYRNPAYLAKVAATVDTISGGRTEMGIGAGWYEHEWRAYGYGFPTAGDRLAALDEGVQIMASMWREGSSTFHGSYYSTDGALCYPQPLQHGAGDGVGPSIPLWIAGGGEKKTLRTAAKYAQYTNFDGSPEGFAHKSSVLEAHCTDVGRDFGEITRSGNYNVIIGADDAAVRDRLAWAEDHYRRVVPAKADGEIESLRNGPLVGTPEQIVETLTTLQGLGMEYAITYFPDAAYDRASLELFTREVVPALQG
ncbi:F420-dependent oxidoreductase-like protein [Sediminihabitans luteus]|uniref:F420-dependent oxidoreductase-like protein n=1 Tax=Sediminihabitans luteus TaxID=1138585 RepID=A0A2M9CZ54_9CELL|nr:LLM class F420-dependent oxidoreductase [Sediminihabitans luteus]PJJ77222.1 F420-dependent oxidoreductase-like protein [Sediminihabitans luteus]GII98670.1 LLM class F420-dependent oxidoreductase [Sediminihabitans luteus]